MGGQNCSTIKPAAEVVTEPNLRLCKINKNKNIGCWLPIKTGAMIDSIAS